MRKLIARTITNLTDARYFAAWYIDYISYTVDPNSEYFISNEKIQEINSWVEGHKTLLEGVDKTVGSLPAHHGVIHNNAIYLKSQNQSNRASGIILHKNEYSDNLVHEDNMIFIDFLDQAFDLDFLAQHPDLGLVVRGGSEEKVGFKSFDELDKLYTFLIP